MVLLENVPQIMLQTIFVIQTATFSGIPLMALIFSLFSIILSVFEYSTKKSVGKHRKSTKFNIYSVKLNIKSTEISDKRRSLKYQTTKLNGKMATILNINKVFVEQLRSMDIEGGLQLIFRINGDEISNEKQVSNEFEKGFNNNDISDEQRIRNEIESRIQNGSLAEFIKNAWNLQNMPLVILDKIATLMPLTMQMNLSRIEIGSVSPTGTVPASSSASF